MSEFSDRVLKCVDCGEDFTFTAGEQQFYREKQFTNEPRRCKPCKAKKTQAGERGGKVETSAVCSQCGRETTVPFRPTQGRPVFCRQCFQGRKASAASAG